MRPGAAAGTRVVVFGGLVLAALAAVSALLGAFPAGEVRDAPAPAPTHVQALAAPSQPPAPASATEPSSGMRPVADIETALFVTGSLRGTDRPVWGTAPGQAVLPNRALRDRFDHYLLAIGEATPAELTALVSAHARRELGEAASAEVLAVWRRYLQLQRHAFQQIADPLDPLSMQAALQEHRQVRQGLLGLHWAQAFYGEEEQALADALTQARTGPARRRDDDHALMTPPTGTDAALLHRQRSERFGADAARRLQAIDDDDAVWTRRVAGARADVDALRADPGRSDLQRTQAVAALLDAAFPDPLERLRAGGLLGQ